MFVSRKLLALVAISLFFVVSIRGQGQPQGQPQGQQQGQPQGQSQGQAQGQPQGQTQGQPQGEGQGGADGENAGMYSQEEQQQMLEMQRAKLWGCYFLAKHRLFTKSEKLTQLLSGNKAEALFKKMVTDIMGACLNNIRPEQSQKIITSLGSQEFNIDDWNEVHGFNADKYSGENLDLKITEEEKFLYTYYTEIDEHLRKQYEDQAEKEETDRRKNVDYEPKIGGLSLKETSGFTKTIYASVVIGSISVLFYLAYKKLFAEEESAYEKVKRERAEKKKRDKSK